VLLLIVFKFQEKATRGMMGSAKDFEIEILEYSKVSNQVRM
jgi:hypothetical protein